MTCLSYDERLHQLDLPRLELRRLHLDLIYCYKIVFDLVAVNIDDFLSLDLLQTPGGMHISCSNRVVLAVFEVVFLLSMLLTCGTDSHHLFVSLHYRPSDEQYMMLICQFS